MLLSWPVAEDVGVVVGGLGGGDCGEGLCSFWRVVLRPNQCRQRGITPYEQALGSHTSPVSIQLSYYKQQTLGGNKAIHLRQTEGKSSQPGVVSLGDRHVQ